MVTSPTVVLDPRLMFPAALATNGDTAGGATGPHAAPAATATVAPLPAFVSRALPDTVAAASLTSPLTAFVNTLLLPAMRGDQAALTAVPTDAGANHADADVGVAGVASSSSPDTDRVDSPGSPSDVETTPRRRRAVTSHTDGDLTSRDFSGQMETTGDAVDAVPPAAQAPAVLSSRGNVDGGSNGSSGSRVGADDGAGGDDAVLSRKASVASSASGRPVSASRRRLALVQSQSFRTFVLYFMACRRVRSLGSVCLLWHCPCVVGVTLFCTHLHVCVEGSNPFLFCICFFR